MDEWGSTATRKLPTRPPFVYFNSEEQLNELEKYIQDVGFQAAKLEEYVIQGIFKDMLDYRITDREGEEILRLCKFQTGMTGLFNRWLRPTNEVNTMNLNKVVLFKDKGHDVPLDILKLACEQFNKYSARVSVIDGSVVFTKETVPPKAEFLFEEMQGFKDYFEVLVLGNEELEEKDIQPFTVVAAEDGKPIVVGFLQGDVSVIPEVIRKASKMFKASDSCDEFWTDLKNSVGVFSTILKEDSCVMFLANNDEFCAFESGDIEKDHDWGASYYGVEPENGGTEKEEPEVHPADAPKKPAFGKSSTMPTQAEAAVLVKDAASKISGEEGNRRQPEGAPIAKIKKGDLSKLTPDQRKRVNESGALLFADRKEAFVQAPAGLHKDELQRWYEDKLGWIPENWKQSGKDILIPASFLLKKTEINVGDLKNTTSQTAITKDVSTKHIPTSMKPDSRDIHNFNSNMIKILGTNSDIIQNPDKMFEECEKADFLKLIGKDHTWEGLPFLGLLLIAKDDPENMARLTMAFQIIAKNQRQRITALEENVANMEQELLAAKPKKPAFGTSK